MAYSKDTMGSKENTLVSGENTAESAFETFFFRNYDVSLVLLQELGQKGTVSLSATNKRFYQWSKEGDIQKLMFRVATKISQDKPNPHFALPRDDAVIPGGPHKNKSVVRLYQAAIEEFMKLAMEGEVCDNNTLKTYRARYLRSTKAISDAFQEMPVEERPSVIRELACNLCPSLHPRFKVDHVHYLFSFLEHTDICWAGNGSNVYGKFEFVGAKPFPKARYDDVRKKCRRFAEQLKSLSNTLALKDAPKDEQFAKPFVTGLLLSKGGHGGLLRIRNPCGLTLKLVSNALTCGFLSHFKECLFQVRGNDWNYRWADMAGKNFLGHFPKEEDWKRFQKEYPTIREEFEADARYINEVMSGVEEWDWPEWPKITIPGAVG